MLPTCQYRSNIVTIPQRQSSRGHLPGQVRTSSQSDFIIFIAMRTGYKWYREYSWNLNLLYLLTIYIYFGLIQSL